MHEDAAETLPHAILLLKQSEDDLIQGGLNALELMGDSAAPAIPGLKRLLFSEHWGVRDRAGRLLLKLSPGDMPPIED